jgi:hypothetical protein
MWAAAAACSPWHFEIAMTVREAVDRINDTIAQMDLSDLLAIKTNRTPWH